MEIITCYYNPANYHNLRSNYWRFRDHLKHPLTTVELSFNDHFEIPDSIQIKGTYEKNCMWQKERLINIAIERSTADKVAWVDADLIFNNPNWIDQANEKLDSVNIVQLFAYHEMLGKDGKPDDFAPGYVYHQGTNLKVPHARPGGAWAARREVFPDGLPDDHILGSADALLVYAMYGIWNGYLLGKMSPGWRRDFLLRGLGDNQRIAGKIDYVDGIVRHLYHGHRANRQYVERMSILTDNHYNPSDDIEIDNNGLWSWCTNKPKLHEAVRQYFHDRKEDE